VRCRFNHTRTGLQFFNQDNHLPPVQQNQAHPKWGFPLNTLPMGFVTKDCGLFLGLLTIQVITRKQTNMLEILLEFINHVFDN